MKTGIAITSLIAVATALAGRTAALDLECAAARASSLSYAPHTLEAGDNFKALWSRAGSGNGPCEDLEAIYWPYDDYCWNWPDGLHLTYNYMMFKLVQTDPPISQTGTCRWRVWGTSHEIVYVYHWNATTEKWDPVDHNDGGVPSEYSTFNVPPGWFNVPTPDGDPPYAAFFLAEMVTDEDEWNMICDVYDIIY